METSRTHHTRLAIIAEFLTETLSTKGLLVPAREIDGQPLGVSGGRAPAHCCRSVFLTGHSRFHPDQSWVSLRLIHRREMTVALPSLKTGDDGSAPVLDESRSFMSDCRLNKYWKPLAGTED